MSITRVLQEKEWNFTFRPIGGGNWGWNSVRAKTRATALKRAHKWVREYDETKALDVESVNCNPGTYESLMRSFW